MKFSTSQQKNVTILALGGNLLGGPDASMLKTKLHDLIAGGTTRVVIDLRDVEFMNSSGLAMLIGGLKAVRDAGGNLRLANASEKIATLIKVTKLTAMFDLHASIEEAVAAFPQG